MRRPSILISGLLAAGVVLTVAPVEPAQALNESAVQVSAGENHTCALTSTGSIKCWGSNALGYLGDGSATPSLVPVSVVGITNAVAVSSGEQHSCAVLNSGGIECWGSNLSGRLGIGTTGGTSSVPLPVVGITSAVSVSAGRIHSCAVLAGGTVQCWGINGFGKLGDGSTTSSSVPVTVSGISTAVSVSAGGDHSCAVLASGGTKCWGWNITGQLGDGTTVDSPIPVSALAVQAANLVSIGTAHSCVTTSFGVLKCWGSNGTGTLGNGTTNSSSSPVEVSGMTTGIQVSSGRFHTCALLVSGQPQCWGLGQDGRLGNNGGSSQVPVSVVGITDAVSISAGDAHSCAALSSGEVKCWGQNATGKLGDGTTNGSSVPVLVVGLGGATATKVVTVDPCVVWDSTAGSSGFSGPLVGGQSIDLQATGSMPSSQGGSTNCGVPLTAEGVVVNVTAVDPTRSGNLRAFPTGQASSGGVVNFSVQSPGLNNSNAVIIPVSSSGGLTIEVNAGPSGVGLSTTHASVTVIGYLTSSGSGASYIPVTPCAFADSRTGTGGFAGPYQAAEKKLVQLTGTFSASQGGGQTDCGVPSSASAALVNLVAVNPQGSGEIGVIPAGSLNTTTFVGYSELTPSMNNSNAVVVPVSASGALSLFSQAGASDSVHIRAVVLGYFSSVGSDYVALAPCVAFDSRTNQGATGGFAGPYEGDESRTLQISGSFPAGQGGGDTNCGVPSGSVGVLVNVVAVNPVREGNLRAFATGTIPTGGIVNFAPLVPAMNNSNAVVVPLSASGTMDVSANGGASGVGLDLADVRGVVLGYFVAPPVP